MNFEIRELKDGEAGLAHSLMQQSNPDPRFYSQSTLDYFENHISAQGVTYGAFVGDTLAAYAVLDFPGLADDNFGRRIGVPENELLRSAVLDACVVHPNFRGHGLQSRLCALREKHALRFGCLHLYASVHPENTYSLSNMQSIGMNVVLTVEKSGGRLRNIVYKKLVH